MTTAVRQHPHRSAFAAAFLSFLFPGLGQAYAGAYVRGVALALPLLAAIAALIAIILVKGVVWFGLWVGETSVLGPIVVLNVVLAGYRAFAAIDAYRQAVEPAGPGQTGIRRVGARPGQVHPLSIAGLIAILIVLVAGHVFVGYWDLKLYNLAQDIHAPVVIADTTPNPSESIEPAPPTVTFPPQMTFAAAPTVPQWTGTSRLNILLVGFDASGRRSDSMMVVSIDPKTHQVAMFSVLRDVVGMPMPPKSRLSQLWGPYFNYKLTDLWTYSDKYRNLFPHGGSDALKQALGYTFFGNQGAIQYYISVGFPGFQKLVDTLGGVTINVPAPVFDNGYPGNNANGSRGHLRVFFQAGIQHMNGDQALTYARIGHVYGSSVYARSVRQQQVVVALEQQANFDEISAHLSELVDQLGQTVKTDIPEGPDVALPLIQLAKSVKMSDIKSYVWATSHPDYAAIRAVVKSVITPGTKSSDELQAAIAEKAPIIVENGTGISGQDTTVATFLQNLGLDAQASTATPATLGGPTQLLCVNGAATQFPSTLTELEAVLGLSGPPSDSTTATVQNVTEPGEVQGFVIITGANLPTMSVPPG